MFLILKLLKPPCLEWFCDFSIFPIILMAEVYFLQTNQSSLGRIKSGDIIINSYTVATVDETDAAAQFFL